MTSGESGDWTFVACQSSTRQVGYITMSEALKSSYLHPTFIHPKPICHFTRPVGVPFFGTTLDFEGPGGLVELRISLTW